MNTMPNTGSTHTILALDLGKYKSVVHPGNAVWAGGDAETARARGSAGCQRATKKDKRNRRYSKKWLVFQVSIPEMSFRQAGTQKRQGGAGRQGVSEL